MQPPGEDESMRRSGDVATDAIRKSFPEYTANIGWMCRHVQKERYRKDERNGDGDEECERSERNPGRNKHQWQNPLITI